MNDTLVRRLVDFTSANVAVYDFQESLISAILAAVVRTGDTVIDGGAHIGRHTVTLAAATGPQGRVFAFEPLPSFADSLAEKFRPQPWVSVVPKALSDSATRSKFYFVTNNPSYSGRQVSGKLSHVETAELETDTVTIDSVVLPAGACRAIKLDLEGGEFPALRGASETMTRFSPLVVFENELSRSASDYGYSKAEFNAYFRDRGYRLFDIAGTEIADTHWDGSRPHFENFLAVKRDEDLDFVRSALPDVLMATLVEMNDVTAASARQLLEAMRWAMTGPTVLFGAGNRARLILERYGIPFSFVADNDRGKWGGSFCGLEVRPPEALRDAAGANVVIASLFADEIERQVLAMGIPSARVMKLNIR